MGKSSNNYIHPYNYWNVNRATETYFYAISSCLSLNDLLLSIEEIKLNR